MSNIIHYGFGTDYLKHWGTTEAMREVYQNFLDYGDYKEKVIETKGSDKVRVVLSNDYLPENLDFLRIGNSVKKEGSIGKHGEGVKMAFMIFSRLGFKSCIITSKYVVTPDSYNDQEIGECFCFRYKDIASKSNRFIMQFEMYKDEFYTFKSNIIKSEDILFSHPSYGDIVDKPKGSVYSGGLFVAKLDKMSNSYNIKPEHLPLDRDRSVPRPFDLNWVAGRLLDAWDKHKFVDESYDDTQFIQRVPDHFKKEVRPIIIGSTIEFTRKDESGEEVVVKSENVKELLRRDSMFEKAIKKLKNFIAKKLGIYDLLLEFKQKHVHTHEARMDFDIILEQVKSSQNKS